MWMTLPRGAIDRLPRIDTFVRLDAGGCAKATARSVRRFLTAAVRDLGIPLLVPPPHNPDLNGCAKCANDFSCTEFWHFADERLCRRRRWPRT